MSRMPAVLDISVDELKHLLRVMRDETRPARERLDAETKVAPYLHDELASEPDLELAALAEF